MSEVKPRRQRGVRLSDLDRSKVYRIGFTGRRWEVLDQGTRTEAAETSQGGSTGACGGAASTGEGLGRHRAPYGVPGEAPQSHR